MKAGADISVRPLTNDNQSACQHVWRGYQACYAIDIPAEVSELTWARPLDPAQPICGALAWDGSMAVGLVHHLRRRSCWTAGDYCYLQDLFVASGARGYGISRKLIEHVYEYATRDGNLQQSISGHRDEA